eukprot:Nk52_evm30s317 gene=Nk52_evmTU30s317
MGVPVENMSGRRVTRSRSSQEKKTNQQTEEEKKGMNKGMLISSSLPCKDNPPPCSSSPSSSSPSKYNHKSPTKEPNKITKKSGAAKGSSRAARKLVLETNQDTALPRMENISSGVLIPQKIIKEEDQKEEEEELFENEIGDLTFESPGSRRHTIVSKEIDLVVETSSSASRKEKEEERGGGGDDDGEEDGSRCGSRRSSSSVVDVVGDDDGEGDKRIKEEEMTKMKKGVLSQKKKKETGKGTGAGRAGGKKKEVIKDEEGDDKKSVQTSVMDFFPVRRSRRRCPSDVKREKTEAIRAAILAKKFAGLAVQEIAGKGKGVVTEIPFEKGTFVCEYGGELVPKYEADVREIKYARTPRVGCYMYYFKYKNQSWCIDATHTDDLGRFINHGINQRNLVTRIMEIENIPRLCFFAERFIHIGEELAYDYGDKSKKSLQAHPWLAH